MGIAVDDSGRLRGLLTFADFGELLRDPGDSETPQAEAAS